jgi:hypothetical protein
LEKRASGDLVKIPGQKKKTQVNSSQKLHILCTSEPVHQGAAKSFRAGRITSTTALQPMVKAAWRYVCSKYVSVDEEIIHDDMVVIPSRQK